MRALLWPLFVGSPWVKPATVLAFTTIEGAALALFARSVLAQPGTVIADTTGESAALASVL